MYLFPFLSDTHTHKHTHARTHAEATQVSHVLVPQYERKIPSGAGEVPLCFIFHLILG